MSTTNLRNVHSPGTLITRIHGVWYDLTPFLNKHPGGAKALSLVAGRDGTVLFESQHQFSSKSLMRSTLNQYRITDQKMINNLKTLEEIDSETLGHNAEKVEGLFEWPEGGSEFAKELVTSVRNYFTNEAKRRKVTMKEAIKATPMKKLELLLLCVPFMISFIYLLQASFISLFTFPIFTWLFIANVFHDASHYGFSSKPWINVGVSYLFPYFSSPSTWAVQHIVGHHSYPNIAHRDPDVAHTKDFRRDHPEMKWKNPHEFQANWLNLGIHWLMSITFGLCIANEYEAYFKGCLSYNDAVPVVPFSKMRLLAHLASRFFTAVVVLFWPFYVLQEANFITKLAFSIIPSFIFSFCFMVNTQINHLSPDTINKSKDWYVHQIITAQNFGEQSYLHYLFSGGLNMQAEHHLFPTVNHCHLRYIQPIVKELCIKHGIQYNMASGYIECVKKYMTHTKNMAKQVKSD
ncbi:hypothetical protein ROZALSC1DRAFT_31404 [Rozella allomycis CSF55]|uniref:Cytochrome b5 heme-binding domain-containing protein n=1 Tax=Rozella allomycis (strain CSF55) TaxID=988480 RepID=A0A4P9YBS8_ROZAC|nr:hypothetical protein ROZALSC1DRAFT_31404 [Rozella allomycis CSF55]